MIGFHVVVVVVRDDDVVESEKAHETVSTAASGTRQWKDSCREVERQPKEGASEKNKSPTPSIVSRGVVTERGVSDSTTERGGIWMIEEKGGSWSTGRLVRI